MSKRVISSDELIAMSNEEVAIELFFMIVQHGEKSIKDVFEIANEIEMHAEEIERRISINENKRRRRKEVVSNEQ